MASPETMTKINQLRQKMSQGLEVTIEEQIEAVRLLRGDRMSAAIATTKKAAGRAAAAVPINGDDLLGEMML